MGRRDIAGESVDLLNRAFFQALQRNASRTAEQNAIFESWTRCCVNVCRVNDFIVSPRSPENNAEPEPCSSANTESPPRTPLICAPGLQNECNHYDRKCLLECSVCKKYYGCRMCHDEEEEHQMDRFATQNLFCKVCMEPGQPIAQHCASCGSKFADYFCSKCRMFESKPGKHIYHCDKCGICRIGRGLGIDQVHCDKCNACIPLDAKTTHPCREGASKADCPICLSSLGSDPRQVLYMRCGHAIHEECFQKYTETSYRCPICAKTLTDMTSWYEAIDRLVMAEELPEELRNRKVPVYCPDCEKWSEARFHFTFLQCSHCQGYNTRR